MKAIEYGSLIRGITAQINAFIDLKGGDFGIGSGQFEYFMLIFLNPGINQLEIARKKNVGKASVTKALKLLEADGLICREVDNSDRRNFRCLLTKKGNEAAGELLALSDRIESVVFEGFTEPDRNMLYGFLNRMFVNAERLTEGKEAG